MPFQKVEVFDTASYGKLMTIDGFTEVRTLFFPQPFYPTGWWSATLGSKNRQLNGFHDLDAANARVETH